MAQAMATIYETKAAQRDVVYRGWIGDVNHASLMSVGVPIYGHATLTPARMRGWFLEGIDAYTAVKRAQALH